MADIPEKNLPKIKAVAAADKPLTLRVEWSHGGENLIDVSGIVNTFRVFTPLRDAPDLFAKVQVGDQGTEIFWNDKIDMANDTLRRLVQEQTKRR